MGYRARTNLLLQRAFLKPTSGLYSGGLEWWSIGVVEWWSGSPDCLSAGFSPGNALLHRLISGRHFSKDGVVRGEIYEMRRSQPCEF
jgi:hypothetical protein